MANTITINRYETQLDGEGEELLAWTVTRALRHLHTDGSSAEIFCNDRYLSIHSDAGWLELGLKISYATGGGMYIACIQRKPGCAFESHS